MAGEIQLHVPYLSGETLYATIRDQAGKVYDVVAGAWDAPVKADWGDYDVALVEQDTDSGTFLGTFPVVDGGLYGVWVQQQAGGSPAYDDDVVWQMEVMWDGAAVVPQTGDSFARIGATGSGLTSLAPASTALSSATWTGTKAGYIDAAVTSRAATGEAATAVATLNDLSAADVNAECDTAISDVFTFTGGDVHATLDSEEVTTDAASRTASKADVSGLSTFDHTNAAHLALFATTDTGETTAASGSVAALAQGEASALTTASIADAVWDEAASGHTTAGTFGKFLAYIDGTFTTLLAAIWAYATRTLTQGAASVASAVSGSNVTVYRGTRWVVPLTGLTDFTGWSKILVAVKEDADDADTASIAYWQKSTAGTGDGLIYWNGAAATAAHGSITVNSTTAITIYAEIGVSPTAVPRSDLWYGIKFIDDDGAHLASIGGVWAIDRDIPMAAT